MTSVFTEFQIGINISRMFLLCVQTELNYSHGHNIMRIFDVLPNFPFTTSETKLDY